MSSCTMRGRGRGPAMGRAGVVILLGLGLSAAVGGVGCGGSSGAPRAGTPGGAGGAGGAPIPGPTSITVDPGTVFQTVEGFGAAVAFYTNWLTQHPNRVEIAEVVFRDLGLDILRTANWSQNTSAEAFDDSVALVRLARASVPQGLRLMMASWSPPASLKSNGDTKNGGTLIQQGGLFAYVEFGQWWSSALAAYAAADIRPDYVSIQNEPNYMASWETCRFGPTETTSRAGYGQALAAVHSRLAVLNPRPKLIGPETAGISANVVQSYLGGLDPAHLDGIAHHLYSGGEANNPDSFLPAMAGVAMAATAAGKPVFMTEYADASADMVDVAWLINNAVTAESAAAYLYWDLVWAPPAAGAPPSGLVTLENPFVPASWTTARGYIVQDNYHALRHYARWVDNGWRRVGASSTVPAVKVAAFVSADGARATLVLVNTASLPHDARVSMGAFAATTSAVYRSSGATERTAELGPLPPDGTVMMPARSIVTVTLTP